MANFFGKVIGYIIGLTFGLLYEGIKALFNLLFSKKMQRVKKEKIGGEK